MQEILQNDVRVRELTKMLSHRCVRPETGKCNKNAIRKAVLRICQLAYNDELTKRKRCYNTQKTSTRVGQRFLLFVWNKFACLLLCFSLWNN